MTDITTNVLESGAAPVTQENVLPLEERLPRPPILEEGADPRSAAAFQLDLEKIGLWFVRRSKILLITFDSVGSVGRHTPSRPVYETEAADAGVSILGMMAKHKDWYRNEDTPQILIKLRDSGFFTDFDKIILIGANMGGFAALAYSTILPGSTVIALCAQSTLNKQNSAFDSRNRFARGKWDWTSAYSDGAEAPNAAAEIFLCYDPFAKEDKLHAARIIGPQVRHVHLKHMGTDIAGFNSHSGLIPFLITSLANGDVDPVALSQTVRSCRYRLPWLKKALDAAEKKGHTKLLGYAAQHLLTVTPHQRLANDLLKRLSRFDPNKVTSPDRTIIYKELEQLPVFEGRFDEMILPLVLPERPTDRYRACGIVNNRGESVEIATSYFGPSHKYNRPTYHLGEKVTNLPGTHYFGGHFRSHFGHFLVEATGRLWALDHISQKVDSIIYLPFRGSASRARGGLKFYQHLFQLLDINIPFTVPTEALRVERLIVPELGFGWKERYAGSPGYKKFMRDRFIAGSVSEGSEKLYVSRSKLYSKRGGILGEAVLERNLEKLGYEIFHPQHHPIEVQLARYRAAREIIALDGSALHLTAYVMSPDARIAMIKRRSNANINDYLRQYRSFCNVEIDIIDAIRFDWVSETATRSDFQSIGELNFTEVFDNLKALGYVPQDFRPEIPTEEELHAMLEEFQDRRNQPLRPLRQGEKHPDEEE